MKKQHLKKAFTLAEILITLGIIGVVAAMTIPTLLTNIQKREYTSKLKKTISELNQAFLMSYNDLGNPTLEETFTMGSKEYYKTYWMPYLKNTEYCESAVACGYPSETPFVDLKGQKEATHVVLARDILTAFKLPSGAVISIGVKNNDRPQISFAETNIKIDVNGGKLPNKFGKDVFWVWAMNTNYGAVLQSRCYNYSDAQVNAQCTPDGSHSYYCCTEKIKRAGWKMDSTYPW